MDTTDWNTKDAVTACNLIMSPPTVSVVIPAFNASDTIGEALDSVEAQEFRVLEIIVVDDASTDGTADVAEEWAARVPAFAQRLGSGRQGFRVRVVRLGCNSGPAVARNRGVAEARGEWIAFLDADDAWLPWRLGSQMDMTHKCSDAVAFCGGIVIFGPGAECVAAKGSDPIRRPAAMPVPRRIPLEMLSVYNPIATSTVLVRKDAVDTAGGFDERFRGPEDYDLWLRLAAKHPIVKLDVPLVRYRASASGLSMDDRSFLPQVLGVIEKAYGTGGVLCGHKGKRKAQAYQMLSCSWMAAERGAIVRALSLFLRSLLVWPGSFGLYLHRPWCRVRLIRRFFRAALRNKQ
jgi:glycosyltransferase involved in cell wall biosynthesis